MEKGTQRWLTLKWMAKKNGRDHVSSGAHGYRSCTVKFTPSHFRNEWPGSCINAGNILFYTSHWPTFEQQWNISCSWFCERLIKFFVKQKLLLSIVAGSNTSALVCVQCNYVRYVSRLINFSYPVFDRFVEIYCSRCIDETSLLSR